VAQPVAVSQLVHERLRAICRPDGCELAPPADAAAIVEDDVVKQLQAVGVEVLQVGVGNAADVLSPTPLPVVDV
jgi:hypothetical protein